MNQDQVATKMAGHALIASLFENSPPVVRITVVPQGQALGFIKGGQPKAVTVDREHYMARLVTTLAGTAAVREIEGDVSEVTFADDLAQVSSIARYMVDHGMSLLEGKGYEVEYDDMLEEADRIVTECREMAESLVACDRERIEALVKILLEKETIEGEEFEAILAELPSSVTPDMVEFKDSL